jgi:hypothetical protein
MDHYSKATGDKGLILHPKSLEGRLILNCYVDANYAGLWGYEDTHDPSCVKSIIWDMSYLLMIVQCCRSVVSRLQTEVGKGEPYAR